MHSFKYSFKDDSSTLHVKTPLVESPKISTACGYDVLLKLDNLQPAGSFKIRGIGNLVQQGIKQGKTHAVSSSGGNSGLAAAYASARSSIPCHVFVPNSTPKFAAENIKEHAAEVTYYGDNWNAADTEARRHLSEDAIYIHPFDGKDIWNGHATIVDELKEQMKGVKPGLVVCSVGGGGLLAGLILGLQKNNWDDVPVLAMETYGADCLNKSLEKKELVTLDGIGSIAKSLGARATTQEILKLALNYRGKVYYRTCHDTEVIEVVEKFLGDHRFFVEPACAATLVSCYKKEYLNGIPIGQGPIVLEICGGSAVSTQMLETWKKTAFS